MKIGKLYLDQKIEGSEGLKKYIIYPYKQGHFGDGKVLRCWIFSTGKNLMGKKWYALNLPTDAVIEKTKLTPEESKEAIRQLFGTNFND